jgi:Family of unknown function (DUF6510)
MDDTELTLDGNALGGLLREIFVEEVTEASGTCDACGAVGAIAELVVYAHTHAPGTVGRCQTCGAVLLRVVRAERRIWVDLRGLRSLELHPPS